MMGLGQGDPYTIVTSGLADAQSCNRELDKKLTNLVDARYTRWDEYEI